MGSKVWKRPFALPVRRSGKGIAVAIASVVVPAGLVAAGAAVGTPLSAKFAVMSMPAAQRTGDTSGIGTTPRTAAPTDSNWTVYHGDVGGSGAASPGLRLSSLIAAWTSPTLDGNLYGEPLVWNKRVYVATENDTVYALSISTGRIAWSRHLAIPVPAGDLPCGNIGPTVGITSTPVIDTARNELFVVADRLVSGRPYHELYGLSTTDGVIKLRQHVDPPRADTAAILQRASLTLDGSDVIFGFGGNYWRLLQLSRVG